MTKKLLSKEFSIAIDDIYDCFKPVISFIRRDINEFYNSGITIQHIEVLDDLLEEFHEIPSDNELYDEQLLAEKQKDILREQLFESIAEIMVCIANCFGIRSMLYQKFKVRGLNRLDNEDMLICARRIYRNASKHFPVIVDSGLTSGMLNTLKQLYHAFDNAIALYDDAVSDRLIILDEKTKMADKIIKLLHDYCEKGKSIWQQKDDEKYNDYSIFDIQSFNMDLAISKEREN